LNTPSVEQPCQILRVAILGHGAVGAIVASNPQRQKQVHQDCPGAAIVSNVEEIWNNADMYDLVVVATPNSTHRDLGLSASQAGLSVVIEKPMALSVSDVEQLLAVSKTTGTPRQITLHILSIYRYAKS
jgi:predicted dehydrogenase